MNKRGSTAFVYLMVGIIFFLLGLALSPALVDTTGESRDDLNCSNSSISNQDKAICYQLDTYAPLWIGVMFGFAGIILARVI